MKNYTIDAPEFSNSIIIPETTDTNHADNVNAAPKQLLQNTLVNRGNIEELQKAVQEVYQNANEFTLAKIAELINGAPTTADTLKEIADLIADNRSVVDALDAAVGNKIDKSGGIMTGDLTATKFHGNLEGIADSAYYSTESGSLKESDTRNDNKAPSWYQIHHPLRTISELKFCGIIGLSSEPELSYCTLITTVPWSDESGGYANQTAICNSGRRYTRTGQENDLWSSWDRLITANDAATASVPGLTKLYTSTGTSTDGTMTRAAITDALSKRASNTWSYITTNGATALQLPLSELISSGEVIVHIQINSTPLYCYSWTVIPGMLNADGITLIDGYKTGNFEGFGQVYINNKIAQIVTCKIGGNDYINDCKLILYYRS